MDIERTLRRLVKEELGRTPPVRKGTVTGINTEFDSYVVAGRSMISGVDHEFVVGDVVLYSTGVQPVIVAGPLTGSLPTTVIPDVPDPPDPIVPPVGTKIDPSRLVFWFDPAIPDTINQNRASGQLFVAGARFQVGDTADDIGPDIEATFPGVYDLTGYNTVFSNNAIRSFVMDNGSDLRWGPVTVGGRTVLCTATQFTAHGYDPANNHQPLSQLNLALERGVGKNDPIFGDGSRCQWNQIENPMLLGPTGTLVRWSTEIRGEAWMDAGDWTTCPFEIHAPIGANVSSPLLSQIINGDLIIWSRDAPAQLDFATATNSDTQSVELARIQCPDPGSWLRLIYEAIIDPTGNTSHFAVYQVESNGVLRTLASTDRPYGFWYTDQSKNGLFYPVCQQLYGFHQFQPTEIGGSGNPPWNWSNDGGWGVSRQLCAAFGAMSYGEGVSLNEHGQHAIAFTRST